MDKTPFYAEGGGQVYDKGIMETNAFTGEIKAVEKAHGVFSHKVYVKEGTIKKGDNLTCRVDVISRNNTARNHTATHLLQKALREVVGTHVEQAGSYL